MGSSSGLTQLPSHRISPALGHGAPELPPLLEEETAPPELPPPDAVPDVPLLPDVPEDPEVPDVPDDPPDDEVPPELRSPDEPPDDERSPLVPLEPGDPLVPPEAVVPLVPPEPDAPPVELLADCAGAHAPSTHSCPAEQSVVALQVEPVFLGVQPRDVANAAAASQAKWCVRMR
ncbi:MAG: hypothetical protein HY904_00695 [Deltaproteobacteria bacterium]|nr:hypothetical protein [Deltaproteobacteria bacterium]